MALTGSSFRGLLKNHITGRLGGFQLIVPPLADRIVDLGLLLG